MIPPPDATPCRVVAVEDRGSLCIRTGDGRETVKLYGVELAEPLSTVCRAILTTRLADLPEAPRCRLRPFPGPHGQERRAQIFVLAWKDKSGDVWMELSHLLLEQGCAVVAPEAFPERREYLEHLSSPRAEPRGEGGSR